jgi:hypothetical protein
VNHGRNLIVPIAVSDSVRLNMCVLLNGARKKEENYGIGNGSQSGTKLFIGRYSGVRVMAKSTDYAISVSRIKRMIINIR